MDGPTGEGGASASVCVHRGVGRSTRQRGGGLPCTYQITTRTKQKRSTLTSTGHGHGSGRASSRHLRTDAEGVHVGDTAAAAAAATAAATLPNRRSGTRRKEQRLLWRRRRPRLRGPVRAQQRSPRVRSSRPVSAAVNRCYPGGGLDRRRRPRRRCPHGPVGKGTPTLPAALRPQGPGTPPPRPPSVGATAPRRERGRRRWWVTQRGYPPGPADAHQPGSPPYSAVGRGWLSPTPQGRPQKPWRVHTQTNTHAEPPGESETRWGGA